MQCQTPFLTASVHARAPMHAVVGNALSTVCKAGSSCQKAPQLQLLPRAPLAGRFCTFVQYLPSPLLRLPVVPLCLDLLPPVAQGLSRVVIHTWGQGRTGHGKTRQDRGASQDRAQGVVQALMVPSATALLACFGFDWLCCTICMHQSCADTGVLLYHPTGASPKVLLSVHACTIKQPTVCNGTHQSSKGSPSSLW